MKIPNNMTEQEVIDQINIVVNRIAPRYTFYGYTVDDIKQESFIICMEALNRYQEGRPLENFLSVNLSNRLKNFVRDHHFIGDGDPNRQRVYQPAQLDFEDNIVDEQDDVLFEDIDKNTIVEIINKYLPASMRMDYLKMINDVYIPKNRREEIMDTINNLLVEYGYYENGQD